MTHKHSHLSGIKAKHKIIGETRRLALIGLCELARHHTAKATEYYEAVKSMSGSKDPDGVLSDYIFADHGDFDTAMEKIGFGAVRKKARR